MSRSEREPDASGRGIERIVLVGFMGAGKTTVGRRLADALGWAFVDVDREVERDLGADVPEIFERLGEPAFREAEASAAARILSRSGVVVATGGGWADRAGSLEGLPGGTLCVWLRVSPGVALERLSGQPRTRPLLAVKDPLGAARTLLAERSHRYGRADVTVDTDGRSVDDVTATILAMLEEREGRTQAE